MSINRAVIMGRLGQDPELRTTSNGTAVCSFSVAVDRDFVRKGEERQTDWIRITAWRQTAEFVSKYFRKGSMIAVEGRIQTGSYTDRDGNNRDRFEIVADNVSFCGGKRDDNAGNYSAPVNNAGASYQTATTDSDESFKVISTGSDDAFNIADEDLPF
ncbi:MAG: single-stranded DNA-binding protein [Candidatus Fimenecus sp.]